MSGRTEDRAAGGWALLAAVLPAYAAVVEAYLGGVPLTAEAAERLRWEARVIQGWAYAIPTKTGTGPRGGHDT